MADNKNNTGNPDRSLINMSEDYEVTYWKEKFNVSSDELEAAVKAVGNKAELVEEYLMKNR